MGVESLIRDITLSKFVKYSDNRISRINFLSRKLFEDKKFIIYNRSVYIESKNTIILKFYLERNLIVCDYSFIKLYTKLLKEYKESDKFKVIKHILTIYIPEYYDFINNSDLLTQNGQKIEIIENK